MGKILIIHYYNNNCVMYLYTITQYDIKKVQPLLNNNFELWFALGIYLQHNKEQVLKRKKYLQIITTCFDIFNNNFGIIGIYYILNNTVYMWDYVLQYFDNMGAYVEYDSTTMSNVPPDDIDFILQQ